MGGELLGESLLEGGGAGVGGRRARGGGAASVPATPMRLGPPRRWAGNFSSNLSLRPALPKWAIEVRKPGMLNPLVADVSVTVRSAAESMVSIGMCVAPGKTRSAWISSLTIVRLCAPATAAIDSSSVRVNTRPLGLCGLQSKIGRAHV